MCESIDPATFATNDKGKAFSYIPHVYILCPSKNVSSYSLISSQYHSESLVLTKPHVSDRWREVFLTICYFYRYINLSLCLCFAESYREKIQKFLLAGTKECRNLVIRFGCAWDDKRSKKVMGSKETRDRVQKRTREYNHDTSVFEECITAKETVLFCLFCLCWTSSGF